MTGIVKPRLLNITYCRRILSLGLFNAFVLFSSLFFTVNSFAADDGTWTYDIVDETAEVTGCIGTCPTDLIIPDTIDGYSVISIGYGAFGTKQLTSVTIPDSVTSIEDWAFFGNQLISVLILDGVISIGDNAFRDNQLTGVTIPDSVISIGDYAFRDNQLTGVTIPDSVTLIGASAFQDNQLTSVKIGNSVTSIGRVAFAGNQLTGVIIPNSLIKVDSYAFAYNQLTSVVIPDSVTLIGDWAFAGNQLTSVAIPNSVTIIENSAFSDNQLTNVTIGNGITHIMTNAFSGNQLTGVTIGNGTVTIDEGTFSNNPGIIGEELKYFRISDDAIVTGCADSCPEDLNIPETINGNTVTYISERAFAGKQLKSVTIPDSVTSIGDFVFTENKLTSVTIGNSVTSIGEYAFRDNQLTSVEIPSSVIDIGYKAFQVNELTFVQFFGDRPSISHYAFDINSLNTITYCSDTSGWPGDPIENITPIDDCDSDGISNDVDLDDDNDGVADDSDAFPSDPRESVDTDLDGIGNNADTDDDGDGIADNVDNNPLVFDEIAASLYSGQLHVLPDLTEDGIAEVGVLRVDVDESKVRLEILNGKDRVSLDEIVWVDNFSDPSLTLHVIPDMNNNGVDEVGLFGIQDITNNEGKPQMFVRDLKTGNKVGDVYNWVANWKEVSALILDDMTGDGISEIAIQGRFEEGNRPQLIVKTGNTNTILDTYSYPDLFVSPQYYQHSDINGDGFAEIATFGRLSKNNKIQIKLASGINAGTKMPAYNFPDNWDNVSWHRLDDSNGDGQDDWGMFGTFRADGRPQLVNKDGVSPVGALRIFAWPAEMENAQFFRIPDMNNDGVDEVAAAGQRSNNDRHQFQTQDGTDRNVVLANHNLNLNLENISYHVLPDLSGDEKVEIGFLGINPQGEYELVVQHGDILNGEFATYNLGNDWQSAPDITSLGDTDDDGLPELLIYGQNAAGERLIITAL